MCIVTENINDTLSRYAIYPCEKTNYVIDNKVIHSNYDIDDQIMRLLDFCILQDIKNTGLIVTIK